MSHDHEAHKDTSKSVRLLDTLAASPEGMTFGELQWLAWGLGACQDGDGKTRDAVPRSPEPPRGYWCDALIGNSMYRPGLLRCFARKDEEGRYHRNDVPHLGRPWAVIAEATARALGDSCLQALRDAGHTIMVHVDRFEALPGSGSTLADLERDLTSLGFRVSGPLEFHGNVVGLTVSAER